MSHFNINVELVTLVQRGETRIGLVAAALPLTLKRRDSENASGAWVLVFQSVTTHWLKAGRWRREKNYRMGSERLMAYLQGFPEWWARTLSGQAYYAAVADAMPPLYVYHLFATRYRFEPRTMLDVYAGIGGWLLGVALYANRDFYYEAVEVDRERCRALEASIKELNRMHFIRVEYNVHCMDARRYEPSQRFDLVVGSPPCEDASNLRHIAKGREAGTYPLTENYLRIVEEAKPRLALYENVPSDKLAQMLRGAGFRVEVVDMSSVIPQQRRRLLGSKMGGQRTLF